MPPHDSDLPGNSRPAVVRNPAVQVVPAIKREKLMIERIGLAGLLALWLAATSVACLVPIAIGVVVFHSLPVGLVGGVIVAVPVAARAVFRIRRSLAQWRQRHRGAD
jgi:hypothetical protein